MKVWTLWRSRRRTYNLKYEEGLSENSRVAERGRGLDTGMKVCPGFSKIYINPRIEKSKVK
jgi:hypothetical protein